VRPDKGGIDHEAYSDRVEVDADEHGQLKTSGGLYIPENIKERAERRALTGRIIAIGSACEWTELREGVQILFGDHAPWDLEKRVPGYEGCLLLAEDDVFCVMEERDAA
jgi:co-chaperonin GroES (HSP10)